MSRLYGRIEDVRSISDYLKENYNGIYTPDKTIIKDSELEHAPNVIESYLTKDIVDYLNGIDIEMYWDRTIRETTYSGYEEEKTIIAFPTKEMREEYRRDLMYFMGDLLRRKNLDKVPNNMEIICQYSSVLPLLIEYLFLKESGKEDRFSPKNLRDLKISATEYLKRYKRKIDKPSKEDELLDDTLVILIALSSMDATLQIRDMFANDKDGLIKLIDELYVNENHNREEIMRRRDIDTYGFKTLRKEIDRYKRG